MINRWLGYLLVGCLLIGLGTSAIGAADPQANKELAAALKSGLPSVVKLGADWCPPCRAMKPELKKLAAELKGKVNVLDLNVENQRELAKQLKITLIPTTIFYDRRGKSKGTVTGFQSKEQLLAKIKELKLEK
jgi:thioredoxin 1